MDFDKVLKSLDNSLRIDGEDWYKEIKTLRDNALEPDSVRTSGESPVAVEYEAAVNWYNIKRESHLTEAQSSRLTSFIALGWKEEKSQGEKNVLHWKTLKKLGIEDEFQETLSGRGTEISNEALKEKIGDYLITFISEVDLTKKLNPVMDSFEPLYPDPVNELDAKKIIRDFLSNPSPVVWCSSLKSIEDDIQKTLKFDETAQRLGMSHAPTGIDHPYKFYGIKISVEPLIGDLKFPTVADARLFHVFEPSLDRVGFTLDLRDGEPSLPEVVIRRGVLKKAYDTDPGILEVVICEAHGAKRNRHAWVLTDAVGCKPKHQKNRLDRVRKEAHPGV
jgi:hypothetical protein